MNCCGPGRTAVRVLTHMPGDERRRSRLRRLVHYSRKQFVTKHTDHETCAKHPRFMISNARLFPHWPRNRNDLNLIDCKLASGTAGDADTAILGASYWTNQWRHIAATYDDATMVQKIYIDGVLKNTVAGTTGTIETINDNLYM